MVKRKMAFMTSSLHDNYIHQYWDDIQKKRVVVPIKIQKTYEKVVKDINNPGKFHYDDARAKHAIYFIENYCRHSQGEFGGKKITLETWERAMISVIFGFIDNDGYRQYRRAVWIVGKKNGKSLVASAVGLYMQIADGEMGPEIVSAATTRDQAKKIWEAAKAMVRMSPVLRKRIKPLVSELSSKTFNFGTFKPLSSDYNTLDGLNLHCVLLDELQQWKNGLALYDILTRGIGARKQPLIFITTTAGTIREDIYDTIYDECELIINGYGDPNGYKDERTIAFIYELDNKQEWVHEKHWQKANPGLGTIKNIDILRNEVEKAKVNTLLVKNLLCKDFNIRETSSETWLSFDDLNNTATFDIEELKPRYCIAGIDLSSTTDLTCATILFRIPNDETIYVKQMYWLPEDILEQRANEDKIPYPLWKEKGLLRTSEGNKVNYKDVTEWLQEVQNEMDIYIYKIGYDSWASTYLVDELQQTFGKESTVPVIQGKKTCSTPLKIMGADFKSKKINYGNNSILKWCLSNTAIDIDKNDNISLMKTSKQRKRIDGTASLMDAFVVYQNEYENYMNII